MTKSEKDRFLKALGQKVDKIRKEKKLSFGELAFRAEMEKANVVRLTKGANVTSLTLHKIANALGVSVKDLF